MKLKLLSAVVLVVLAAALFLPSVALASPEATASRDLPDTVAPGAEFEVGISASDYGMMAQVQETLPTDFSYVSSSLDASQVQVTDNVVKFILIGTTSFTYRVTAATVEDTYIFSGIIKDQADDEYAIAGDTDITVSGAPPTTTATRDLPDTDVAPGAEFEVGISASDYGMMAQVQETLPTDFSYVSSSLDASQVQVTDNVVKFILIGTTSFTYRVTAATVEDTYIFSGLIKDQVDDEYTIGGDTDITVSTVVGPVSFTFTLPSGWNLLSTPIKLDADSDTMEQILGESEANIEASWRWDTQSQQWEVPTGYELSPLEAVYLKVSSGASATAEFIPSEEPWGPPSRVLQEGLNLIGPAPALEPDGFLDLPLDQALVNIEQVSGGLRGYTLVISPGLNQPGWAYAVGVGAEVEDLLAFNGYWVVMENGPDTLYGFSTTPISP